MLLYILYIFIASEVIMRTIPFTEFRKDASSIISLVEHGEKVTITKHGKPVVDIIPSLKRSGRLPSWKKPALKLDLKGGSLTRAIIDEREAP